MTRELGYSAAVGRVSLLFMKVYESFQHTCKDTQYRLYAQKLVLNDDTEEEKDNTV